MNFFVEFTCLFNSIVSGKRITYKNFLVGVCDAYQFLKLVHQILVCMISSCGVDEHNIHVLCFCVLDCVKCDSGSICSIVIFDYFCIETFCMLFKLMDRCSTKSVA